MDGGGDGGEPSPRTRPTRPSHARLAANNNSTNLGHDNDSGSSAGHANGSPHHAASHDTPRSSSQRSMGSQRSQRRVRFATSDGSGSDDSDGDGHGDDTTEHARGLANRQATPRPPPQYRRPRSYSFDEDDSYGDGDGDHNFEADVPKGHGAGSGNDSGDADVAGSPASHQSDHDPARRLDMQRGHGTPVAAPADVNFIIDGASDGSPGASGGSVASFTSDGREDPSLTSMAVSRLHAQPEASDDDDSDERKQPTNQGASDDDEDEADPFDATDVFTSDVDDADGDDNEAGRGTLFMSTPSRFGTVRRELSCRCGIVHLTARVSVAVAVCVAFRRNGWSISVW